MFNILYDVLFDEVGWMTSYRLQIPDEKWNKFKDTLSKNQTINEVIENWIDQQIQEDH